MRVSRRDGRGTAPRSRGSTALAIAGAVLALFLAGSCAKRTRYLTPPEFGPLTGGTIALNASTGALPIESGVVLTDNDDAFRSKIDAVDAAQETIDLAYFIFSDDHSSAVMSEALLRATERGVRVRMLLDYQTNYKNLDMFSMLEAYGNRGPGGLQVRFYNRPTRNIVKDAVFLTLGCGEKHPDRAKNDCARSKYAEIDALFAAENVSGNYSNLNVGNSGLFLSGLYAKNAEIMAFAVQQGQRVDVASLRAGSSTPSEGDLAKLQTLARIYYKARFGGGLDAAVNRVKLALAFALYGDEINPVYDKFTGYLPVEHPRNAAEVRRDWSYVNDVLHHKILLVDGECLVLGGRNFENSYHMTPHDLIAKYVFMDTDVVLHLAGGGDELTATYDRLWDFELMVAGLDEVRRHAPNDFLEGTRLAKVECAALEASSPEAYAACYERALAKWTQSRDARLERRHDEMTGMAAGYERYERHASIARSPRFMIDRAAEIYYVENLPFLIPQPGDPPTRRAYGAINGMEGEYGKHIHALWLEAMRHAAAIATPEEPQTIIIHNAYFLLPSNLMALIGRMVDGTVDAGNVKITVLTNSIETTDLNVINIAARHQMKAFADYYAANRDAEHGASFSYHEYRPTQVGPTRSNLSLHTKIMVFGPDIWIGSANADVRSYMQDSNNGLLIRNDPELVASYTAWLEGMLADDTRTADLTSYFIDSRREDLTAEDLATQRQIIKKYGLEGRLGDPAALEQRYVEILDAAYNLTSRILRGGASGEAAERDFDELFKGL